MPCGEFKHRYWFFADTLNVAWIVSVIWKELLWRADLYRLLKYRGGCTIPLFQLSVWCENCVAARHFGVIGKQLKFENNRNRVRGAVLCLLQDGACTNLFENFSENSLKSNQMVPLTTSLFSHWSIPLMRMWIQHFQKIWIRTLIQRIHFSQNYFFVLIVWFPCQHW